MIRAFLIRNRMYLGVMMWFRGYTTGAEVGVADCVHAKQLWNSIPGLYLVLIDPFLHLPKEEYDDSENILQSSQDIRYENACMYAYQKYKGAVMRMRSAEAAKHFQDNSLDFVYIDANHKYESVKEDLNLWWPKIREGGMLCGHDWQFMYLDSVVKAISEFAIEKNLDIFSLGDVCETDWFILKEKYAENINMSPDPK